MKAATYYRYGGPEVIDIESDIAKPVPKENELLVKVKCTTVTAGAVLARRGSHPDFKYFTPLIRIFFGLFRPRIHIGGYEFSGVVEALGKDVKGYQVGERVFGTATGLKQGGYAEYICVPTAWKHGVVSKLPDSLSFEDGAGLPVGAMTAHDLLGRTKISRGTKVLVYGASGSVGTYMLQLAKARGGEVTAVCSERNRQMVIDLGADHVLDYRSSDYEALAERFDVIADGVGKMKKKDRKRLLKDKGAVISISSPTSETMDGLEAMTKLAETGQVKVFIDKIYDFEEIRAAHDYAETGHKRGNVILRVG